MDMEQARQSPKQTLIERSTYSDEEKENLEHDEQEG